MAKLIIENKNLPVGHGFKAKAMSGGSEAVIKDFDGEHYTLKVKAHNAKPTDPFSHEIKVHHSNIHHYLNLD